VHQLYICLLKFQAPKIAFLPSSFSSLTLSLFLFVFVFIIKKGKKLLKSKNKLGRCKTYILYVMKPNLSVIRIVGCDHVSSRLACNSGANSSHCPHCVLVNTELRLAAPNAVSPQLRIASYSTSR